MYRRDRPAPGGLPGITLRRGEHRVSSSRLIRAASAVAPLLGPCRAPALFGALARLTWKIAPARGIIEQNKRHLPPHQQTVRESIESFGRYLGEFFSIEGRPDRLECITTDVRIDSIRRAIDDGRTVLAVSPHFGNWELAALWLGRIFGPVQVITRRTGDPVLDVRILRARGANELIDVEKSGIRLYRALMKPGIICAAIDEPSVSGLEVSLLGHRVFFARGLFEMAARAHAVIIPTACRRLPDGRLELVSTAPAATPQEVADQFDRWIRADPGQWVMLRPYSILKA